MSEQLRVPGHGLLHEGRAFPQPPCCYLSGRYYQPGTGGPGHAKCSCGATSPHLLSGGQRKAWHREHKQQVLDETGGSDA